MNKKVSDKKDLRRLDKLLILIRIYRNCIIIQFNKILIWRLNRKIKSNDKKIATLKAEIEKMNSEF